MEMTPETVHAIRPQWTTDEERRIAALTVLRLQQDRLLAQLERLSDRMALIAGGRPEMRDAARFNLPLNEKAGAVLYDRVTAVRTEA
jgi:hypothetical protein